MRVAVQSPVMGGAFSYILHGIINALKAGGVDVVTRPHVHLGGCDDIELYIGSLSHAKGQLFGDDPSSFKRLPGCRYALHSQPFVDHLDELQGIPNKPRLDPTEFEIDFAKIVDPEVLWGYGWDIHADLWSKWGRKWQSFMPAGDSVTYFDQQRPRPDKIVFLGGDWAYKRPSINRIIASFSALVPELTIKVGGWGRKSVPVPFGEGNSFLNTGLVGFCPSEPHTKELGIDVPERVFKLPLAGVVAVHDNVPFLGQMMPKVPIGKTAMAVAELCMSLAEHDMNHLAVHIAQKHWVLTHHTYFCRLKSLAEALNMPELALKMANQLPIVGRNG